MEATFNGIEFKHSYRRLKGQDPVSDFLIPTLEKSVCYQRSSGYFSSLLFSHIGQGIGELVQNGGRMQLITSHAFTSNDARALDPEAWDQELENSLVSIFESSYVVLGDEIQKHHVRAMLWMLQRGLLEIKVVVPKTRYEDPKTADLSLFHPKYGIFTDSTGARVAFAGSLNETANGWLSNIENISVYQSNSDEQIRYIDDLSEEFQSYWNYNAGENWVVLDLPEAVKRSIIASTGTDSPIRKNGEAVAIESSGELRPYQQAAIRRWMDSGKRGILEMATGTGKTRTARECISLCAETSEKLLTIVVAPFQHIADQWAKELSSLSPVEIASLSDWRKEMEGIQNDIILDRLTGLTIVVVKNTAGSADFSDWMRRLASSFENVLVVADEVHWLGAEAYRAGLLDEAEWRLGLSATPSRYLDEDGSEFISDYFRPLGVQGSATVFEFTLRQALHFDDPVTGRKILCPYNYFPVAVQLSEAEEEDYLKCSASIARLMNAESSSENQLRLRQARIKRALITKKAAGKVPKLEELISEIGTSALDLSLIYCAESSQMAEVGSLLSSLRVDFGRITSLEGARPSRKLGGISQREEILQAFSSGVIDTVLAIDCLDEGVDIPAARRGFILASSGNPKEFIQRRGRLMRQFPGKEFADIYDFVVLPPPDRQEFASLRASELKRVAEFAEDAHNGNEVMKRFSLEKKEEAHG